MRAFICIVLNLTFLSSCMPCRFQSEELIKRKLLKDTPVGISNGKVKSYLMKKRSKDYEHWKFYNEIKSSSNKSRVDPSIQIGPIYICSYITGFLIGEGYRATWIFEDEQLKEVNVSVYGDGP